MLLVELQGVNQTYQLVDVTTQGQVVDQLAAYHAFVVDQEGTAERHAAFGFDIVGLGDLVVHVRGHGVFHRTDTAVVDGGVAPGVVGEVAVDGHADHFHAALFECVHAVIQGDQFGRAHKGEVQRIEEHQAVFALDGLGKGEFIHNAAVTQDGGNRKIRCGFTYQYAHVFPLCVESMLKTSSHIRRRRLDATFARLSWESRARIQQAGPLAMIGKTNGPSASVQASPSTAALSTSSLS